MGKNEIKKMLMDQGMQPVETVARVAMFLKINPRTLNKWKLEGKIKPIDKATYSLNDIVNLLYENPRYIARIFEVKA